MEPKVHQLALRSKCGKMKRPPTEEANRSERLAELAPPGLLHVSRQSEDGSDNCARYV